MFGQMMHMPLNISALLLHAAKFHGDTPVVSRQLDGSFHHSDYATTHQRASRLAHALQRLGVQAGDRVGTLAWNGHRHLELYYGISGLGAITHTINPRLFPEQIAYIVDHADDGYVFFDLSFAALIDQIASARRGVRGWVALCHRDELPSMATPNVLCYEDLLMQESEQFDWPRLDEQSASSLCYTSGTTGNPKGVLYSHRSTLLHAFALAWPDSFGLSAQDVVAPAVPMFHVNAWGLPYACAAVGAALALPGTGLDGKNLYDLFETQGATFSGGVPTVWNGLLAHMKQHKLRFSTLQRVVIGGSACPPALIRALEQEHGVQVIHAWGMTELSPLGTTSALKAKHKRSGPAERDVLQAKQGRPLFGVDMRIVGDDGQALAWDGRAFGSLQVRGPWVVQDYFKEDAGKTLVDDGWFATGDVATLDPDGYMQITDRSKDVIKSGGEWISSIELEGIAMAHPGVAEAAVIAVAHPKWEERPLLLVVKKPDATVTREELLQFFEGKVAKWWLPDDAVFVEQLPHTATGKLLKTQLRETFRQHRLPDALAPVVPPPAARIV